MNAKMTKAQEAEQSFLLSVSHELKTPLTSIRGYAEGLADGALPAAEGAAVIGAESARLERLVGDLLDSARMRKSAFTVRRETVDLVVVARGGGAPLRNDGARRRPQPAAQARAREPRHGRSRARPAGGLQPGRECRALHAVAGLGHHQHRARPGSVSDTGQGLTNDDLPRAFERFYLYSRATGTSGRWAPAWASPSSRSSARPWTAGYGSRAPWAWARRSPSSCPLAEGRPPGEAPTEAPTATEMTTAAGEPATEAPSATEASSTTEVTTATDLSAAAAPSAANESAEPVTPAADPAEPAASGDEPAAPTTVVVDPSGDGE